MIKRVATTVALAVAASFGFAASAQADSVPSILVTPLNGKCVDLNPATNGNFGKIYQWDCHPTLRANQEWVSKPAGGDTFVLTHTRNGYCLDANPGTPWNGGDVYTYQCNGSDQQKWRRWGGASPVLQNVKTGLCLDAAANESRNGGRIQMWQCYNPVVPQQTWYQSSWANTGLNPGRTTTTTTGGTTTRQPTLTLEP